MPFHNTLVSGLCPHIVPVSGPKFGLEIEAEGSNIPRPDFSDEPSDDDEDECYRDEFRPELIPTAWRPVKENSLRGEGCEYVFAEPYVLEDAIQSIDALRAMFIKAESKLNKDSTRTSTHLHINVSDFRAGNLASFLVLYLLTEEMLFEILRPIRRKNLFCLRTRHAPAMLLYWRKLFADNPRDLDNTHLHYSALSISSIFKYGTLEFRGGHGPSMEDEYWDFIKNLIRFFANLREIAISNPNPVDMLEQIQEGGAHAFYAENFYPYFGAIMGASEFRVFERALIPAFTLVKDIQWDDVAPAESVFDPDVEPVEYEELPELTTGPIQFGDLEQYVTEAVPPSAPSALDWNQSELNYYTVLLNSGNIVHTT